MGRFRIISILCIVYYSLRSPLIPWATSESPRDPRDTTALIHSMVLPTGPADIASACFSGPNS